LAYIEKFKLRYITKTMLANKVSNESDEIILAFSQEFESYSSNASECGSSASKAECESETTTPESFPYFRKQMENPFFLNKRNRETIGIDNREFQHFEEVFLNVLLQPHCSERQKMWKVTKSKLAENILSFVQKYEKQIKPMIEYGAVRNYSLMGNRSRRIPIGPVFYVEENYGKRRARGHWGSFNTTTIDQQEYIIKTIKFDVVKLKEHTQYEHPVNELDFHRQLMEKSIYLPRYFCCVTEEGKALYVSEKGEGLMDWYYKHSKSRKKKDVVESMAKNLFYDYLTGLQKMHDSGVSHGDVKLDNFIYLQEKFGNFGKLIDLGCCVKHPQTEGGYDFTMKDCHKCGTQMYKSPERRFHLKQKDRTRYFLHKTYKKWDAAKDDLWGWAFSLLSFLVGGPLWNCRTSSTDTDVICFHLGTNMTYASPEAKSSVENWFSKSKKEKGFGIQHLLRLRYCPALSQSCVDLLEKIFVPQNVRLSLPQVVKHPFFNLQETA